MFGIAFKEPTKSPLDTVALAYLSLEDEQGEVGNRLLRPVTIEILLSKHENKRLRHGDQMAAWRYDEVQGITFLSLCDIHLGWKKNKREGVEGR